jgi:hypothetical protein
LSDADVSDIDPVLKRAYLDGYNGRPAQGYTTQAEYEYYREGQLAGAADGPQLPTLVPDQTRTEIIPYQSETGNFVNTQDSFTSNQTTYEADGSTAAKWVVGVFFVIGLLVLFNYIGSNDQSHSTASATTGPAISSAPAAAGNNDNIISEPSPFQAGAADRRAWESWFASTSGDYQAGAEFWAGQRSLKKPAPCDAQSAAADRNIDVWIAGCLAAQERLAPTDIRRHSDPEYRRGWNNP